MGESFCGEKMAWIPPGLTECVMQPENDNVKHINVAP